MAQDVYSKMPPSNTSTFRFLDLPREIRNKIYRELLCSFEPRPTTYMVPPNEASPYDILNDLTIAGHSADTSILFTSKQLHREAYDVMVKTNRFVRVNSSLGLPLRFLLNHLRVPVVSEDSRVSAQFQGYVLSVSLTCPKDITDGFQDGIFDLEPCSLMMLSRDMECFCDTLGDGDVHIPGFGTKVAMEIVIAPAVLQNSAPYKDLLADFFSEKIQESLLQPFRHRLRGFKNIKVWGSVSSTIAAAAENDIAQDMSSDPEAVIFKFQTAKNEGQNMFRANKHGLAWLKWQDSTVEIEQLRNGSSWTALVKKGGIPFVTALAELYFLMKLNTAHTQVMAVERGEMLADVQTEDALMTSRASLERGFWMPDFQWVPTDTHMAKWWYRHALYLRLIKDETTVEYAVSAIGEAHRLLPNDSGIAKEQARILRWKHDHDAMVDAELARVDQLGELHTEMDPDFLY